MFVIKSYHTAGHAEIYAQGDFIRPQISSEAIFVELRTYQVKHGVMPFSPEWKKGIFPDEDSSDDSGLFMQFVFIPPLKHVRFPAHDVKTN